MIVFNTIANKSMLNNRRLGNLINDTNKIKQQYRKLRWKWCFEKLMLNKCADYEQKSVICN